MKHSPANLEANSPICVQCSRAAGSLGVCPSDSKPIHLHADCGYCPLNKLPAPGDKPGGWDELPDATESPQPTPAAKPPLLAGDLVELVAKRIGADRAAKWLAKVTMATPNCGCEKRKQFLNRLDRRIRRWFAKE